MPCLRIVVDNLAGTASSLYVNLIEYGFKGFGNSDVVVLDQRDDGVFRQDGQQKAQEVAERLGADCLTDYVKGNFTDAACRLRLGGGALDSHVLRLRNLGFAPG